MCSVLAVTSIPPHLDVFQLHDLHLYLHHLRCHGALGVLVQSSQLLHLVIQSLGLHLKFVFQLFLIQLGFLQSRLQLQHLRENTGGHVNRYCMLLTVFISLYFLI